MNNELLILHTHSNFKTKLQYLRQHLARCARFSAFDQQDKANYQKVVQIVDDVINIGDEAVAKYTKEFDKVTLSPEQFRIASSQLAKAHKEIDRDLLASIRGAIANVRKYQQQLRTTIDDGWETSIQHQGSSIGIRYTPIKRVGIYVPGGSAALGSTVIMTAVPALVAGTNEIAIVSPPRYNGTIHPVTLAVCWELGIDEVYRIGGAQAIAALAAEKTSIPKVDKIVGPGNRWVQTAKLLVAGLAGVDCIAGPSEVLIIAQASANPVFVAIDMISQVEHNPGVAFLFTDSQDLAEKVLAELKKNSKFPRSMMNIVVFKNMDEIITQVNEFAPEHLEIQCGDESKKIADKIENAGAIFIGDYTPVAVGDYWAGPSHTLPTGTTARFFSGLSVYDFIKSTSIIQYTKENLAKLADDIIRLAKAENLNFHAESIKIRQKDF